MRRLIGWLLVGFLIGAGIELRLQSQGGVNPLMSVNGKVDENNALVVSFTGAATAAGGVGPLGNLQGKVDANNALVVTAIADASGNVPFIDFLQLSTVNTAAPAAGDCNAAGETGRLNWDSTNDVFRICSGASGWNVVGGSGGAVTFVTVDTGQGANELYDMDQNVLTTSTPQFARLGVGVAAHATDVVSITSASTTDVSDALKVSHTGAITGTGYGGYFSKTGASTTNVGLYVTASGATNNYAAIFEAGSVTIGAATPTAGMGFDVNGRASFASGSAVAPSVVGRSNTNTGLYWTDDGVSGLLHISAGGANVATFSRTLNVGFGQTVPTAIVHLKAGTATASTAPLKFTSGTLLTTAEAGAVEFLTDAFYGTITTGAARKTFAFLESPTFTTPTLGVAAATTLDTGFGANELYDMDQHVLTTSSPTFVDVTVTTEAYDATGWNADNTVPTKDAVRDKIETLVSSQMTLLKANSGTTTTATAENVDTVAISGLTAKDRLSIHVVAHSLTQATATLLLYNTTDSLTLEALHTLSGDATLVAGNTAVATTIMQQAQEANTAIRTHTIGASRAATGAGASLVTYATATTAWTGSWTLALRQGGVTSGGTLRWSWAVYKVAGQ